MKIQGYSALILASGFANVIKTADNFNLNNPHNPLRIRNLTTVHDSSQNLFSINLIWDLVKFYRKYFYDFAENRSGIKFDYDLEIGIDYGNTMTIKQLENDNLQFTGTGSTIRKFLYKVYNESDLKVSCSMKEEEIIPNMDNSAMSRFIKERQCCMEHDDSKYTITLKKLI